MDTVNFVDVLVEEIALEGLDGITLPTLWLRLDERGSTKVSTQERLQGLLWHSATCHQELCFYLLPEPRPDIEKFDRFAHINSVSKVYIHPEGLADEVYGYEGIQEDGVIGSCPTFKTRKDITAEVRNEDYDCLCPYAEAMEKWGRRLVVVASQVQRNLTMTGNMILPPSLTDTAQRYCLLERIARARWNGLTTGTLLPHYSSNTLGVPTKLQHYIVNSFCSLKLVRKQMLRTRYNGKSVMVNLLHLQRFYREIPNLVGDMRRSIARHISKQENKLELMTVIRDTFNLQNRQTLKTVVRDAKGMFCVENVLYRSVFPNAPEAEYLKNGSEKKLQVVTLVKDFAEEKEESEDDEQEENGEETCGKKLGPLWTQATKGWKGSQPLLSQFYMEILSRGTNGATLSQLVWALRATYRITRGAVYCLQRQNKIKSILKSFGQHRTSVYVALPFLEASSESFGKALAEFKQKTTELCEESNVTAQTETSQSERDSQNEESVPALSESAEPICTEAEVSMDMSAEESTLNDAVGENIDASVAELEEDGNKLSDIVCTFVEDKEVESQKNIAHPINEERLTERMLVVANILLDVLKHCRVMDNMASMKHSIQRELMKAGSDSNSGPSRMKKRKKKSEGEEEICSKTILRLVNWCHKEGKLNKFNLKLKFEDKVSYALLVCARDIQKDHSLVKAAIEKCKLRHCGFFNYPKKRTSQVPAKFTEWSQVIKYAAEAGSHNVNRKKANNAKKWEKVYIMHRFLWYIIYGYQGTEPGTQQRGPSGGEQLEEVEDVDVQLELRAEQREANGGNEESEPPVYLDVKDWRRYIPPLKRNSDATRLVGRSEGVCSIGDMLMVMPLSVFVQLSNMQDLELIQDYLSDSNKRHYPTVTMPHNILGALLQMRIYINAISDVFRNLCNLGILAVGPLYFPDKTKQSVYLRKTALLLDTRESLPGNLFTVLPEGVDGFPEVRFQFDTMNDVQRYWSQLRTIALNTDLNNVGISDKPSAFTGEVHPLKECLECRKFDIVVEDCCLPGNRLGAAGTDSSLFLHLRRNWSAQQISSTLIEIRRKLPKPKEVIKKPVKKQPAVKKKPAPKPPKPSGTPFSGSEIQRLKRIVEERRKPQRPMSQHSTKPLPVKYRTARVAHRRSRDRPVKKSATALYDETDYQAFTDKKGSRTKFCPKEITIIMLGKVAMNFLLAERSNRIYCTVIRDILHERVPSLAYDKTTRAVQACIVRQVKRSKIRLSMSHFQTRLMQDKELMAKYSGAVIPQERKVPSESEMCSILRDLINDLLNKFMVFEQDDSVELLPSTLGLLKRCCSVVLSEDPKTVEKHWSDVSSYTDVCFAALRDFQLSHMLSIGDKQSRNYEMYATLKNYPDQVVRNAFQSLIGSGLIVKNKRALDSTGIGATIGRYCLHRKHVAKLHKARDPEGLFSSGSDLLSAIAEQSPAKEDDREGSSEGRQPALKNNRFHQLPVGIADAGEVAMVIGLMAKNQLLMRVDASSNVIDLDTSKEIVLTEEENRRVRKRRCHQLRSPSDNQEDSEADALQAKKARKDKDDVISAENPSTGDTESVILPSRNDDGELESHKRALSDDSSNEGQDSQPARKRVQLSSETTSTATTAAEESALPTSSMSDGKHELHENEDGMSKLATGGVMVKFMKHRKSARESRAISGDEYKFVNNRASFTLLALRRVHPDSKLDPRHHSTSNRLSLSLFPVALALREKDDSKESAVEQVLPIKTSDPVSSISLEPISRESPSTSSSQSLADTGSVPLWIQPNESGSDSAFLDPKLLENIVEEQTKLLPFNMSGEELWMNAAKELDVETLTACQDVYREIVSAGVLGRTWHELKAQMAVPEGVLFSCLKYLQKEGAHRKRKWDPHYNLLSSSEGSVILP